MTDRRPVWALVLLCLIWAYAWIAMKYALRFSGPVYFAALRTAVGTVCLFGAMLVLKRDMRLRAPALVVLLGLFQTSAFIVLTLWALSYGAVSRVSVLNFTMPFWVALLAWPLLGERVRGWQWLAIGMALLGLILVAQPWRLGDMFLSAVLACGAGFSWAFGTVIVKRFRREFQGMDALALTAWQMLVGVVPLIALTWIVDEPAPRWTPQLWACVIYLGVLGTAVAWVLWVYCIMKMPANLVSLNSLAIPTLAVLFAWLQFGEQPSAIEFVGMLLIAAALVLLAQLARAKR